MAPKQQRPLVLDSCVWIAYLYTEDSQHEKACRILQESTQRLFVPEYVLLEVVNVFMNRGLNQHALSFMDRVLCDTAVFIPAGTLAHATSDLAHVIPKMRLSFVDIALLVLSERYEIVTFDTSLAHALQSFAK